MRKLANLKGAKALNRKEQKAINGGAYYSQLTCENAGGTWVCIGAGWPHECGCVFDNPVDPPNQ